MFMCGIAGFIDSNINYDRDRVSNAMGLAIYNRGPDSSGLWHDNDAGVSLIHRRLSILDLSESGHQPMLSKASRYVIAFNGEIYNWRSIRLQLEKVVGQINWAGHSDTEVLLMAIEVYGIDKTVLIIEGMFAIALWDRIDKVLYLVRDRIGEKPLYYGYSSGVFMFASELKAIKQHPKFQAKINQDALGQLLLHNCIPAPLSIYVGIYKLMPGKYLKLSQRDYKSNQVPTLLTYWQLQDHITPSYAGNEDKAIEELDQLLQQVISEQMVADVPVGCFLSGGIDSSLIASIMQKVSSKPIETFSIGFHNPEYNEAPYASAVAKHLGTKHNETYVSAQDALNVVEKLPDIYDEPFSDSSQIPTYLVSQIARKKVTVCLSGDAGDELFLGYQRYTLTKKLYSQMRYYPDFAVKATVAIARLIGFNNIERFGKFCGVKISNIGDKVDRIKNLTSVSDYSEFYLGMLGHWLNYAEVVKNVELTHSLWQRPEIFGKDFQLEMQYLDTLGYLTDDILVKVDRAAMSNSLETRVPFLNHRVIEFAYSLPMSYKVKAGVSKWILHQILSKYVPRQLFERPKKGFGIPLASWLKHDLRDWAENLLNKSKLDADGYFNSAFITKRWQDHITGKADNGYYLWDILMFQQWLEHNR